MKSQELRKVAPEIDSLHLSSDWNIEDLKKAQIFIQSSFGNSHPRSAHLDRLVKEADDAVRLKGGFTANYYVTDICDGEAQGHNGMNYSLVSREIMTAMIVIQVKAIPFDGGISS